MAQTIHLLTSNVRLLSASVSKYALCGVLIAVAAIVVATLAVGYYRSGAISLTGIIEAQRTNPALWFLNLMPFVFAFWGQYVSSLITYEASAMVVDQTSELRAQATVFEHQAMHGTTHDALTDLPNRVLMHDRLERAISSAQHEKHYSALLLLDLNRFKEINNTLGHHQGDLLLKQVATRLRGVVQEPDSVARVGGDEFAILLAKIATPEAALQMARRTQNALNAPFTIGGLALDIRVSMGVALYPEHGVDADTLQQHAEVAMHAAKQRKDAVLMYAPALDEYSPYRLTLTSELRQGIDHNQLLLHYQPKITLSNGEVFGVEALVRWQHPRHGLMHPNDFIPLAERTGLIKHLTSWVLNQALQQCRVWQQEKMDMTVAVNISAQALLDLDLPDIIAGRLAAYDLSAQSLILEITESAIMADTDRALRILTRLAEMGVRLSIDDFGTGYSSLAYLSKLPASEIKIDRSFVAAMTDHENDAMIVRATIDLAHNLGLMVIAEGVESSNIFAELKALGCDAVQGYYISPPLDTQKLTIWMRDSTWRRKPG